MANDFGIDQQVEEHGPAGVSRKLTEGAAARRVSNQVAFEAGAGVSVNQFNCFTDHMMQQDPAQKLQSAVFVLEIVKKEVNGEVDCIVKRN